MLKPTKGYLIGTLNWLKEIKQNKIDIKTARKNKEKLPAKIEYSPIAFKRTKLFIKSQLDYIDKEDLELAKTILAFDITDKGLIKTKTK